MKNVKKIRIRHINDVDICRTWSGCIYGAERGYADATALETHSNTAFPTLRTMNSFVVICIVNEKKQKK